jgi:hypothetical protein
LGEQSRQYQLWAGNKPNLFLNAACANHSTTDISEIRELIVFDSFSMIFGFEGAYLLAKST